MKFGRFKPDEEETEHIAGFRFGAVDVVHYWFHFANGYTASVIQGGGYTYGGEQGLWELAVLKDGEIDYDNPVTAETGGTLGYLDDSEVAEKLEAIEALPTWHKRKRKKRR